MLFGEHAVVHGYPCIVTTVSSRIYIEAENTSKEFKVEAPQSKDTTFAEETVKLFCEKYKVDNKILIKTYSDFSSKYGFGSSSAVTIAVIYALSNLYKIEMTKKEVFDLGYKVVQQVQGVGSGFDIAAAVYGGTLYFLTGGKMIEPLSINNLSLVIGYSGMKANTSNLVKKLKADFHIFDSIKKIVETAKKTLIHGEWEKTGELMNQNHKYLQQLGVSTKKLDDMCRAAISSGAFGAKLSGAGGGDCMIALVSSDKIKSVGSGIVSVGGEIINVKNNAEGVKLEKV